MTDLPERWKWRAVSASAERAPEEWIVARVEACLSHYYRPDLPEAVDALATATWLDVLGGIPQDALEQAFGEWEREEERRPTPAGIRKRAMARVRIAQPVAQSAGDWEATDWGKPADPAHLARLADVAHEMGMPQWAPGANVVSLKRMPGE